jgi:hypothetical protein
MFKWIGVYTVLSSKAKEYFGQFACLVSRCSLQCCYKKHHVNFYICCTVLCYDLLQNIGQV